MCALCFDLLLKQSKVSNAEADWELKITKFICKFYNSYSWNNITSLFIVPEYDRGSYATGRRKEKTVVNTVNIPLFSQMVAYFLVSGQNIGSSKWTLLQEFRGYLKQITPFYVFALYIVIKLCNIKQRNAHFQKSN
jgi:hypothetical protein